MIDKFTDWFLDFDLVHQPKQTIIKGAALIILVVLTFFILNLLFKNTMYREYQIILFGLAVVAFLALVFIGVGIWYLPEERRIKYEENKGNYQHNPLWNILPGFALFFIGLALDSMTKLDEVGAILMGMGIILFCFSVFPWLKEKLKANKTNKRNNKKKN